MRLDYGGYLKQKWITAMIIHFIQVNLYFWVSLAKDAPPNQQFFQFHHPEDNRT